MPPKKNSALYQVRLVDLVPARASFPAEALAWLLAGPGGLREATKQVGVTLSVKEGLQLCPVLLLANHSRLVVVRFASRQRSRLAEDAARAKLGAVACLLAGEHTYDARPVHAVAFRGALVALLLWRHAGVRVRLLDLSSFYSLRRDIDLFRLMSTTFTHTRACFTMHLTPAAFAQVPAGAPPSVAKNTIAAAREAVATWQLAANASPSLPLHGLVPTRACADNPASFVLSTFARSAPTLDFLAEAQAAARSVYLSTPKTRDANVERLATRANDGGWHIRNTRYQTRVQADPRQHLKVFRADGQQLEGRARDLVGRRSDLRLPGMAGQQMEIERIVVVGRGSLTAAELDFCHWVRDQIRRVEVEETGRGVFQELTHDVLPDLYKQLLFSAPTPIENFWDYPAPKGSTAYALITASHLNASQRRAARAMLAPLPDEEGDPDGAIVLVHGPPGSGKTATIARTCVQWLAWGKYSAAIYVTCQSNAAVKNVTRALRREGVRHKIIVSNAFHDEWHEDMYRENAGQLLLTQDMHKENFQHPDYPRVILCTLSLFSHPKLVDGSYPLFAARPPSLLMVDEASQLHASVYGVVIQRFEARLARVCFLGDPKQLAPFGSETIKAADWSVFEITGRRVKAPLLLNTSYRLPRALAAVISRHVYDGQLESGPDTFAGALQDCVRFVHVHSVEVKPPGGTSYTNAAEVHAVVNIARRFEKAGVEWRCLTTYDAQRAELEVALKRAGLSGDADRVFNVDAYQGQEAQVIIASLVRAPRSLQEREIASVGFLSNMRRSNVLLTRCKRGLVVVSNRELLVNDARGAATLVGRLAAEAGPHAWLDNHLNAPDSAFPGLHDAKRPAEVRSAVQPASAGAVDKLGEQLGAIRLGHAPQSEAHMLSQQLGALQLGGGTVPQSEAHILSQQLGALRLDGQPQPQPHTRRSQRLQGAAPAKQRIPAAA